MVALRRLPVLLIAVLTVVSLLAIHNILAQISRTHAIKLQQELQRKGSEDMRRRLSARVCGSPAVDGYAHVDPTCLENCPTNTWFREWFRGGGAKQDGYAVVEKNADYDGIAVRWGIGHYMASAEKCAESCRTLTPGPEHEAMGPFSRLPCNAFSWCSEDTCFEPDAHKHSFGDCWLKFTEGPLNPEVNMRGLLPDDYRQRHATAPHLVPWHSGVILPQGLQPSNGTWSPRYSW